MKHTDRRRASGWRVPVGRTVAAVVAIGVLATSALAMGSAGAATSPRTATEISTAKNDKLGTILVSDTAVYTLKPGKKPCDAKCLKVRPPVLLAEGLTAATAGNGVDESKLGTKTLADGSLQVTYAGKPLYWFGKDKTSSQVRGNVKDKWGKWAAVVTVKSHKTTDTTNPGTGGSSF